VVVSNKETVSSQNDAIESISIDATQATAQASDDREKTEEAVKEIFIDSLDDIDKPGIFVSASFFLDSSNNTKVEKNNLHEKINYQKEIHIFMSSFFLGKDSSNLFYFFPTFFDFNY
jgi:hypothetical protein